MLFEHRKLDDAATALRSGIYGPPLDAARASLTDWELDLLARNWRWFARKDQIRPGLLQIWLYLAGRGTGKTRSAAEDCLDYMESWGSAFRGILCNKTVGDVRDVMIEGESGLKACAERRGYQVRYIPSQAKVVHPSGAVAYVCSSEQPEKPRGYQTNYVWADEIAAWHKAIETFDNLLFGWRLPVPRGGKPLMVITTTPRANAITHRLLREPTTAARIEITRGRTQDNKDNLADGVYEILAGIYEGTRKGREELDGEYVEGQGTIVKLEEIHDHRVRTTPENLRKVVALDPTITATENSDAAGIVVVGAANQEAYVLDDRTIEQASFAMWARATVEAFLDWDCECVIAEINQGGTGIVEAIDAAARAVAEDLGLEQLIVPVRTVWAKQGKKARAEPVGALYERGWVHHVGVFKELEKELTTWMPGMESPNRMDALVYGVTHLLLGDKIGTAGPVDSYL